MSDWTDRHEADCDRMFSAWVRHEAERRRRFRLNCAAAVVGGCLGGLLLWWGL